MTPASVIFQDRLDPGRVSVDHLEFVSPRVWEAPPSPETLRLIELGLSEPAVPLAGLRELASKTRTSTERLRSQSLRPRLDALLALAQGGRPFAKSPGSRCWLLGPSVIGAGSSR